MRTGIALLSALVCAAILGPSTAQADYGFLPGDQGFTSSAVKSDGSPATQAGSHPDHVTFNFALNTHGTGSSLVPDGDPKNIQTELPETLNPQVLTACTEAQLESDLTGGGCPDSSQVGTISLSLGLGLPYVSSPLYNMVAPHGSAAAFGYDVAGIGLYAHILGALGPPPRYGFSSSMRDISAFLPVTGGSLTLWGVPSDSAHDAQRGTCLNGGGTCPVERTGKALLTLPTDCSTPMTTTIRTSSWEQPDAVVTDRAQEPNPIGCSNVEFRPQIAVTLDTQSSDSPAGLLFDLKMPQNDSGFGLGEANLKKSVFSLPTGLTINPSAAPGLGACSEAQLDLSESTPANCPDTSKIGSAEVETPLLDHLAKGSIYLATPKDNPFGSTIAIYIVIDDPSSGIVLKFAAQVTPDLQTGQITTVFDNVPKLPFSDLKLDFFGGPRGNFRTPTTCGTFSATADISPWSAVDPDHPTPAETATPTSSFQITQGPNGLQCAQASGDRPHLQTASAGTQTPLAGVYTPFSVRAAREDGYQEMRHLEINFPPGFAAKLAGVTYCSDAAIAAADNRSGLAELSDPSCPASSLIGYTDIQAGAGPHPVHFAAPTYLAGPYLGAPLSLEVITPVVTGPFDFGDVDNRTAIYVDPNTAAVKAVSDPFPRIIGGIPADTRSIAAHVNRSNFFINPTSCDPLSIGLTIPSSDSMPSFSVPFQMGGCGALGFSPKLSVDLDGKTGRSGHPALTVDISQGSGQANIANTVFALPPSEQIDQGHIKGTCSRSQFAADACPPDAIYGQATAESPLLDQPVSGPIYLQTNGNPLPDVVLALHGQVSVNIRGQTKTVHGRLQTTFDNLPDVPITHVHVTLYGGKKGLIVNNTNICAHPYRASVLIDAHNGLTADQSPLVGNSCRAKGNKKRRKHKSHKLH